MSDPVVTARDDAFAGGPTPVAHRIRETIRAAHKNCNGCILERLWAEDIQEILDLAARDTADAVPAAGHLDLDDVLQRHRNVARALSENGTSEETLQGWHAFAGWLRNGMPDEPDVRGDVPDTGVAVSPAHVWFVPEEGGVA